MSPVVAIAILVTLPLQMLWRAYVVAKLWLWFIVPLGVRALSVVEMLGALFVFSVVTYGMQTSSKEDEDLVRAWIKSPIAYAISIGIGYALRFWILG